MEISPDCRWRRACRRPGVATITCHVKVLIPMAMFEGRLPATPRGVRRPARPFGGRPAAALLGMLAVAGLPGTFAVPAAPAQGQDGRGEDVIAPGLSALAPPGADPERDVQGLQGMAKMAIDIEMARELPGLGIDAVEDRLERRLAEATPAPAVDPTSADRLQVTITVEPVSSAELRGFYLPFSGHYAIGAVRLAVIRPVRIAARQTPVAAIVWQAERPARGPWRGSGPAVLARLDELLHELLDDYQRAVAPR